MARKLGKTLTGWAVVAALAGLSSHADAAPRRARAHPAAKVALRGQPSRAASIGAFTPATADPRLAALFARGVSTGANFRFTPSATPGSRRAVTVAIRARSSTHLPTRGTAVELADAGPAAGTAADSPLAYNLGVAFGWQHFALSGDYTKLDTGLAPGGHEAMDVGLSYGRGRWSTRLSLGADRSTDRVAVLAPDRSLSLDLGGSYAVTRNIDLTGGLRYRALHDRFDLTGDDKRDAQSVYVGTAFRF